MKVILSRKGFDSENGNSPSPILPDGTMFSIPIPSSNGPVTYSEITSNGANLGSIVESITSGKITGSMHAHLDPDLERNSLPRAPGWMPAFGQVNSALSHLDKQGITIGDLFLFFGWFRGAEELDNKTIKISESANNIHAIFGWLQVGEIIDVGNNHEEVIRLKPWLSMHPHVNGIDSKYNKIYIASDKLSLPSIKSELNIPGGGAFRTISNSRILTHPDQDKRTLWVLPEEFSPTNEGSTMTYHGSHDRWSLSTIPGKVTVQSVSKGQEFVIQCSNQNAMNKWIEEIFSETNQSVHN